MQRLNWNWGLACVVMLAAACGGKADDDDGTTTDTSNVGDGDGDGDTVDETAGDGDGDGGTDAPTSYGDKEESCAAVCELAEACGATDEDCVQSCSENKSVSNAGQEALAVCFDGFSCSATQQELLGSFLCISDELEDTPLSAEQRKFCDVTSKEVQECTGEEPDITLGDCAAQVGLVSDELLEEVNGCDQTDCDDLQACVNLQLLQELDVSQVTAITTTGEISARGLSDLLALFVVTNQLGTSTGLEGAGGGAP